MILGIDLETYSSVDLKTCGLYKYVESPDFEILMCSYAIDDGPVEQLDFVLGADTEAAWSLARMLTDPAYTKAAYNAQFEIACLSKWLGQQLDESQWRCTAVLAASAGLPRSLGDVGKALGLPQDKQKDSEGSRLIRYFSCPCKPTKSNGMRTRNLPEHKPEDWQKYLAYNRQDVVTEREIRKLLEPYKPDATEQAAWELDQRINRRGVMIDRQLVGEAIGMSNEHTLALQDEAKLLTGLENPNSVAQLKGFFGVDSLTKKDVEAMREEAQGKEDRVLEIRQELGLTSIKKYQAMANTVCKDGRIRGLFQFYGAGRTGRWSGRLVQLQNLKRNYLPDLSMARDLVRDGDVEGVKLLFGNVPGTLSELVRTALIPSPGKVFAVADYAAIEARIIAHLSCEKWRQEVFRNGGDIYCASASQMFKVPVEKHGQNSHLRQKGKIAELALGYGGSVGALTAMGALEMGLQEEELKPLVDSWREANPAICAFWWNVGDAAIEAVKYGMETELPYGMRVWAKDPYLNIMLPSGRVLRYYDPKLAMNRFGGESLSYQSYEEGRWGRVESYGPKFVENIVQGIARDCLRDAMMTVEAEYPDIVMHIHDEIVVEVDRSGAEASLEAICNLMAKPIEWAPGLLLRGDGYLTDFYRKD